MGYKDLKYYFTERLIELYDWDSIDSYRVRSHNAFTLICELRDVIDNWLKGNLKDFERVKPCVCETYAEVKEDDVLDYGFYSKELLLDDLDKFNKVDKGDKEKSKNTESCQQMRYLLDMLIYTNKDTYLETLYEKIWKMISCDKEFENDKEKTIAIINLEKLTMALASELIYEGYSQRHLYKKSQELHEKLSDFERAYSDFKENHSLSTEKKDYDIVFKVYGGNNQKVLTLDGFISIPPEDITASITKKNILNFLNTHGNWIFYYKNVKAHDSVMAISMAKDTMDEVLDKAILGYSMLDVKLNQMALVTVGNQDAKFSFLRSLKVMDTTYTDDGEIANQMSEKIDYIIDPENKNIADDVKDRLKSALRHLRMGNAETDSGQKLVNYWVALEFLFSSPKASDTTITRLEKNLINILSCGYAKRRLLFLDNLVRKDKGINVEKYIWEMDVNEITSLANNMPSQLLQQHLLKIKQHLYGHKDKAVDFLKVHREHLKWHIYRIYRYRNQLIHEAAILPGLDNVIRCLHFYLVYVLDQLIGYFSTTKDGVLNMDSFFYEYALLNNKLDAAISVGENKYKERLTAIMDIPLYQELIKSK